MARRHYNLPTLSTLAAFEAAARNLSFKNAARELNVTPGAVSHQVKALESELGTALFDRKYRGVELTINGRALFSTLEVAFFDVSSTLARIRKAGRSEVVTIGATSAVSSLWLTSAVTNFWRENGDISVSQIVSDVLFSRVDRPDLVITYGKDKDAGLDQKALYRDVLVPVCSPELYAHIGDPSLEELAKLRLVHLDAEDKNWTTWQSWFSALGYDGELSPGFNVNNYTIALQVARDGAGVVLGWKRLIASLLNSAELVVVGHHSFEAPNRFHITSKPDHDLSESVRLLRDWLLSVVEKDWS